MLFTAVLQQDLQAAHLEFTSQHSVLYSAALLCAPQSLPSLHVPSLYSVNDEKVIEVNLLKGRNMLQYLVCHKTAKGLKRRVMGWSQEF